MYGNTHAGVYLSELARKAHLLMSVGASTADDMVAQLNCGPSILRDALKALEENRMIKKVGEDSWQLRK